MDTVRRLEPLLKSPEVRLSVRLCGRLGGLAVFLIALTTYLSTRARTVSWWDCGEFTSGAYKLEVVHEPGAPLFLLIGRIFSLAASNRQLVASLMNSSSAVASALTVAFVFWIITALVEQVYAKRCRPVEQTVCTGAGLTGSLIFCFSDSFWYSAVESEVYALSTLCTAAVFWAILKWKQVVTVSPALGSRWLLFISYLMGLSLGIHLLNLLTIPALTAAVFWHYQNRRRSLPAILLISCSILGVLVFGFLPHFFDLATLADVVSVNYLKLPFGTGAFFFFFTLAFTLVTISNLKKCNAATRLASLCVLFFLIGFSSYTQVLLRAAADPPLNTGKPDNLSSLQAYLSREQYEESPLLFGRDFTAEITGSVPVQDGYKKGDQLYEPKFKSQYIYSTKGKAFFPRMWDNQHAAEYRVWCNMAGQANPSFYDGLTFLAKYQLNFMYLRYFLWNFVGRQNNLPATDVNPAVGNWISGFSALDRWLLGYQGAPPARLKQINSYNPLYFLPLALGLLGLVYQYKADKKGFVLVLLLFLFTGFCIAVYLNMPPSQPRERDYAFLGSFMAFSVWAGMGVVPLFDAFKRWRLATYALVATLIVPVMMAFTNWDDHDRSTSLAAHNLSANYLNSCEKHAVLFTYGDNETYPLWYLQEVEGLRTDVRVINLNLFEAAAEIEKSRKRLGESPPLALAVPTQWYADGYRDYVDLTEVPQNAGSVDLGQWISGLIHDQSMSNRLRLAGINRKDSLIWTLNDPLLSKGQLAILDFLEQNRWKRPVYFCSTMSSSTFMGLDAYLKQEGILYHLMPSKQHAGLYDPSSGYQLDKEISYRLLMERYTYGLKAASFTDDQTASFAASFKKVFLDVAKSMSSNDRAKQLALLNKFRRVIPPLPLSGSDLEDDRLLDLTTATLYFDLGDDFEAKNLLETLSKASLQDLSWSSKQLGKTAYFKALRQGSLKLLQKIVDELKREKSNAFLQQLVREREAALAGYY